MGPTASGKTALAFEMADRLPVELISVDSAQVFKDMNLGTAKPDAETLDRYPHHLIDLITPEESYSAARFCQDAQALMADITTRGKIPLLVGGTMLYFKALMDGLADLPQADPALRAEIEAQATQQGWPALHAELAKLDPETAARLAPNDSQRIQRALEVVRLSGQPMSVLYAAQKRNPLPYRVLSMGLAPSDRSWLHARIAERFDFMLKAGLVDEVVELRRKYELHADLPSMRSVGYRQVWDHLEGRIVTQELRDRGVFATRQFAKRQLTWFNTLSDVTLFDCIDPAIQTSIFDKSERFVAAAVATPS
ncbi:MAG TPA: tRNA (adenosine(37)-N6)-dimethylallyltransferase MiaA [Rhodocyclaceae bacterium]|jgi:tRNA dimethylallyltransferase